MRGKLLFWQLLDNHTMSVPRFLAILARSDEFVHVLDESEELTEEMDVPVEPGAEDEQTGSRRPSAQGLRRKAFGAKPSAQGLRRKAFGART